MVQKGNFKDVLVMKGMGRVDDTRPIDLQEYAMPTSKERKSTPIPLTTVPKKICFSKKIAGTIYDVTANFDLKAKKQYCSSSWRLSWLKICNLQICYKCTEHCIMAML